MRIEKRRDKTNKRRLKKRTDGRWKRRDEKDEEDQEEEEEDDEIVFYMLGLYENEVMSSSSFSPLSLHFLLILI